MVLKRFFVLFTTWYACASLYSQNVQVNVSTNRDSLSIGETLVYSLTISHDAKAKIFGEPDVDFSQFEVTQIKKFEPTEEKGRVTQKTDYLLTTFNIDTFLIQAPKQRFLFNNDTLTASGQPKLIIVTSTIDTSFKDIRPEKPILEGKINWWLLALYLFLTIVAVGGGVYLAIKLFKKYRYRKLHPEPRAVPEIIRTPEEMALEFLEKLKEKALIEKGEFKQFHIEISDIIRGYVEGQFNIPALESTTSELIQAFKQKRVIEENYITLLRRFLEVCDLVKFAKYTPSNEECAEIFSEAYNLVKYKPTNG